MANLSTILDGHPDGAAALVSRGQVTTYGELVEQVGRLRGGLVGLGVRPGERVALLAANNWYFVVSYLAALGTGAAIVPLNPTSPTAELHGELAAVRARLAIASPSAVAALSGVDRAAVGLEQVVVGAAEGASVDGAVTLESVMAGSPAPAVERADGDIAVMIFTAGTAGAPKPAMLSHGALLANLEQVQRHPGRTVRADDVVLGVLPMFHIFGLNVMLDLALLAGASVVLVERFEPDAALETIAARGVTVVGGSPTMFAALAAVPGATGAELRSVRLAVSGAAALTDEVADSFTARFGIPLWQGYGLTEAGPVVTSSVVGGEGAGGEGAGGEGAGGEGAGGEGGGGDVRRSSIGVPIPGVDVRLVDEEGEDALEGDPGEIWVKGPNLFSGYWNDPEATDRALTADGWLRTGDMAVADDDGYLYIVDRVKDVIIVSGFNVYPAEVEEVLLAHPGIAEVAVAGRPHPYSGETVVAFVVPERGAAIEEDDVIAWAGSRLARYKCPTKVTFVESLPQGVAGKVLRRALPG
ncbi:MAG TPA: AMP-binding protein [Acidimicrobiales bacterium]